MYIENHALQKIVILKGPRKIWFINVVSFIGLEYIVVILAQIMTVLKQYIKEGRDVLKRALANLPCTMYDDT